MEGKLKYPVITISREYAAYGRTIAAGLSDRLGIPFYDKDFVKETAKQSGYSEEDIVREGEDMSPASKFMNSLLNNANAYASSYDGIYKAQKEVVLNLAQKPCIIVGRCADHILTQKGIPAFKIFLYADEEHRLERAAELEGRPNSPELKKILVKKDQKRETYYKQYTGHPMGLYKNYTICLDTGTLGVESCIDILCTLLTENA